MLEYIHFIPGRVRLRISGLRQQHEATEAEMVAGAIAGVRRATANPLTGSLTITFDQTRLSIRELWEALRTKGYVSGPWREPARSDDSQDLMRIGRVLSEAFLDTLFRHSAEALLRALL